LLPALALDKIKPILGGLSDGYALAQCSVNASRNIVTNLRVVVVSFFLAREGFDVAIAVLVNVINDPGLADFALRRCPLPFPD
jgi:hypothetical protein